MIPYKSAKTLIKEGDILLFKGKGYFSKLITQMGGGIHSHAAMASWHNDRLEIVEFREFKGGRTVSLENEVNIRGSDVIDVFRPIMEYKKQIFDNNEIKEKVYTYDGKKATNHMRKMTGLPYGYKRIIKLAERYIPVWRWFVKPKIDDEWETTIYPVCSTAIAKTLRAVYVDPVPYKPDCLIEPPDLARSAVLNYLFTIQKD